MFGLVWGFQTQFLTALIFTTVIGMWWAENNSGEED
jgi:hypothetical protein